MPVTNFEIKEKYRYQPGFNSHLESEAVPGALPIGQNSPQKPALGLYAEKLSGTAFTAPRHENKQSWLYRIMPSCAHPPFEEIKEDTKGPTFQELDANELNFIPNQLRWRPFETPAPSADGPDFMTGLRPVGGAGDVRTKDGLAIFFYVVSRNMDERAAFYSADGDMLLVAQQGALDIQTEFGHLLVRPCEIAVVPRGVKYRVNLADPEKPARGYALEIYHGHFQLPELGPIGSNGLANARDFLAPVARFVEDAGATASDTAKPDGKPWTITVKFNNKMFKTQQPFTPFDVVAWQGNYYPYKYDLGRFNTIGTISYDHPDPSIFTVLTASGSGKHGAGTALADFVIFPARWLVAEDTFRPPWFHRNVMAEFMGLVQGEYDAKKGGDDGFLPGGASLHNTMSGHGPDAATVEGARNDEKLAPTKVSIGGLAFMFETCLTLGVTRWGLHTCEKVQKSYSQTSWGALPRYWSGTDGRKVVSHLLEEGESSTK